MRVQLLAILTYSAPTIFVPNFCVVESKFGASDRLQTRSSERCLLANPPKRMQRDENELQGQRQTQHCKRHVPTRRLRALASHFPNPIDVGSHQGICWKQVKPEIAD